MCEVAPYQIKDFEPCWYHIQNKTKQKTYEVTIVLGIFPSYRGVEGVSFFPLQSQGSYLASASPIMGSVSVDK